MIVEVKMTVELDEPKFVPNHFLHEESDAQED